MRWYCSPRSRGIVSVSLLRPAGIVVVDHRLRSPRAPSAHTRASRWSRYLSLGALASPRGRRSRPRVTGSATRADPHRLRTFRRRLPWSTRAGRGAASERWSRRVDDSRTGPLSKVVGGAVRAPIATRRPSWTGGRRIRGEENRAGGRPSAVENGQFVQLPGHQAKSARRVTNRAALPSSSGVASAASSMFRSTGDVATSASGAS
jgi:hypothetical protein